jgi:hypothetical protein
LLPAEVVVVEHRQRLIETALGIDTDVGRAAGVLERQIFDVIMLRRRNSTGSIPMRRAARSIICSRATVSRFHGPR